MSQPSTIQVNYYEPNDLVFNNEDLCYAVKLEIEVLQRGFGAIKTYTANFVSGTKGIDMISGNGQVLTTSYTDINMFEIENGGNRESLGVESINIKYNSWYFPEVTIKFVDVRGNAVFNSKERENDRDNNGANGSFFNALFMFPYPLYRLTVKGYYGSPVAYNLTVRDMRATFNNATGNFEITVDFIGHAYGYLVDIPSRLLFLAPSLEYGRMKPSTHIGNFMNGSDKGKRIPTFTQMIKDLYSIERYKTEDEAYISSGDKIQYLTNNLAYYYEIEGFYETIISLIDTAASEGFINTPSYLSSSGKIKITASSTDETAYKKISNFIEQLRKYDKAITEKVNTISKIQTEYDKLPDSVKPEKLKINLQVDSVSHTNSTTSPNPAAPTSPILPLEVEKPLPWFYNFIHKRDFTISIKLIQSNDGDDETLVKTVSEIIRKHEELIARQENLQTAIIEDFFESSLQWRPTINNVFEIVLAHLKYFHSSMQQCISNIETNQAKRLASKIHTDCNSKQDTISLPPFPAFYNESDKHVWCGEVFTDNKLEEEALVDAYFKAAARTKEVLQTEVENYVSYTQNVDVYPRKWMIPTLLCDLKNGTNQYLKCREVEELTSSMDGDDIPYCFRILAMRIINRKFYNEGGLSAKDFGVLEAYNMLRGRTDPKMLKHSVWTDVGENMVTVVSECIAKYLKDNSSKNFTETLNDLDVKWDGTDYKYVTPIEDRMRVWRPQRTFTDWKNGSGQSDEHGYADITFDFYGLYLERTMWDKNKKLYIGSEEEYKLAMDRNIYGIVTSADCDIDQYKKVFPDRVPIRHFSSTLKPEETAITPATHFAVITSSGTLRLFHTFHDTENLIANIKAKNAYMVSAVRVFDDDDYDGDVEGIAEQRHLRYSADASEESAKLFLLSLVNFPIGEDDDERFDRIGAFGGIYKIPSLFLLALGCCYKFYYTAANYSGADSSLYDNLLRFGGNVFYNGLDFYDFARDYYDKNFSRFFEEYKTARKLETAKKLTGDADDDSDVEAMFEATDADGGTEKWEIHYAYTKYNDNTKKFLVKWLDDMVFVYNAHGETHYTYRTSYNTPTIYPLNFCLEYDNTHIRKQGFSSLSDANDCRQYFEVTDIVPAFIDTVRNLTNVLVADDVEALPPVPVAVSVDRKMAMYDVFKQIYDRWKIGDSDSRVELYTAEHINNNFIFRDTFNNEIGNDIRVDIKKLVDMLYSILNGTDNDMSVYSFLNQVCADAHCLMLSLPTNVYASFSGERALERLFTPQPYTSMSVPTSTTFIITYNHKYAEHLNYSEGESAYKDDGVDFRNHFVVKTNAGDNNQLAAFGITYSLGKQRFFNNIQVSMQKPQVTEQSLASLLSIANDGSTHGGLSLTYDHHDLFDTYSQHSYMCDVEMMGNAQIMPMMYFQLNNIPLFKGGYMIVSAEHTINKDGMKTSFKGARVSKYQFDFTKLSNSTAILYGEGDEGHVSTTTPEIVPSQYEGREFTHHSYSEFVRTNKTYSNGSKIPNNPTDENIIENIFRCMEMMEIISEKWISHCTSKNYGEEVETRIFISSCYRCKSVNDAVGSKDSSAHRNGDAIDFYVNYQNDLKTRSKYNQELFNDVLIPYLRDNKIPFDQLIVEQDTVDFQWLHLGLKRPSTGEQRKQVFRIDVKTEKSTDIKTPLF
jgi:hypothetical protein